jgi:arginyl-tRNA synthetase
VGNTFLNKFKNHIAAKLAGATSLPAHEIVSSLAAPPKDEWGDYGWPCFSLAKTMKKAPPAIASELAANLTSDDYIDSVNAEGPYVNFSLKREAVIEHVCREVFSEAEDFGSSNIGADKTIVLEYSSPNIAKPMSIGHLRATILGASLKRIYDSLGYKVISINHIGDWGTQFGKLVVAYKRWADPDKMKEDPIKELYRIYVKIHEESEDDKSLEDESRAIFKKLENGDPEIKKIWKQFIDLSWQEFERIYGMLGVSFDSIAGESFYQDMLPDIIEMLQKKGLTKISQGALIVPLDDYRLEPLLLRKQDGSTLYSTRDLAAAIYRHDTYKFDKMIYVVGVAQKLHFRQFFKVLELAGYQWVKNCEHVDFGWVKLGQEMMSTRKGNIVFVEDVLNQSIEKVSQLIEAGNPDLENKEDVSGQVGIGAVIFANLAVKRQSDVAFDWDRMLDFNGYSGPYLQYAHARLASVLRKHGEELSVDVNYGALVLPEEYKLAKMLLDYPEKVIDAASMNEPYIISSYLLDLAGLFSTYYQKYKTGKEKILSDEENLRAAKVNLTYCIKTVVKSGLSLLGLEAPDKM